MKYLKPFNENTENFKEELLDFCESNLAYLLDEGLQIRVHQSEDEKKRKKGIYEVCLSFYECTKSFDNLNLGCGVRWTDIKDDVIPFLSRLINRYYLVTDKGYNKYNKRRDYQISFTMLTHSSTTSNIFDGYYMDLFTIDEIIDEKVDKDISNTIMYIILNLENKIKL